VGGYEKKTVGKGGGGGGEKGILICGERHTHPCVCATKRGILLFVAAVRFMNVRTVKLIPTSVSLFIRLCGSHSSLKKITTLEKKRKKKRNSFVNINTFLNIDISISGLMRPKSYFFLENVICSIFRTQGVKT